MRAMKIKDYFPLFLFMLFFAAGMVFSAQKHAAPPSSSSIRMETARALFPEARSFTAQAQPFQYMEASDGTKIIGYALLTEDLDLKIRGYGGPVPLIIAFSPDGKIMNLIALPNNESPSYTGVLDNFLKQFINKSRQNPLILGQDIDAISRATVTSDAVTITVKAALHRFATEVLGDTHQKANQPRMVHWRDILIPITLLTLACAALLLKSNPLRWVTMAGGFLFFGVLTHTMLSVVQIANLGLGNVPGFSQNTLWFITLLVAFLPALIIGRIYCGALCPFALVQELLPALFRRIKTHEPAISPKVDSAARKAKYLILIAVLLLCFIAGNAAAANIEPFVTLFTSHNSKIAWAFLFLMMVLGIFHFRFWCVYLCPVGALTSLVSSVSWWRIRPKDGCTRCGECAKACPTRAIKLELLDVRLPTLDTSTVQRPASKDRISIDHAECILCAKCLQSCKENLLTLKRKP
jgi:NosR/NirI family nitrous oxide reductase transcriptional regulator